MPGNICPCLHCHDLEERVHALPQSAQSRSCQQSFHFKNAARCRSSNTLQSAPRDGSEPKYSSVFASAFTSFPNVCVTNIAGRYIMTWERRDHHVLMSCRTSASSNPFPTRNLSADQLRAAKPKPANSAMPQYLNACGQMQAKPSSTLARRMRQKKVLAYLAVRAPSTRYQRPLNSLSSRSTRTNRIIRAILDQGTGMTAYHIP